MDITVEPVSPPPAVQKTSFPVAVRIAAQVISVIFHPLFIPVYISAFLIYVSPAFPALDAPDRFILLVRFIVMYTVFPLATVLLAKALGFVHTVLLKTQKDRIIPYVACGLYYFWMWYVLRNQQSQFGNEVVLLALAIFLASSAGLMSNSYLKVSMHAISVGVMATFMLLLGFLLPGSMGLYMSIALFIAGTVCTARLITSDHHPIEVYAGFAIGVVAQLVAYWFVY